jgi:hypothetical protein
VSVNNERQYAVSYYGAQISSDEEEEEPSGVGKKRKRGTVSVRSDLSRGFG